MKWKLIYYISFALIIPLMLKWYVDCKDYGQTIIFSRDGKQVQTKTIDPLFGTENISTTWKSRFWLGLLPNDDKLSVKFFLGVVPIGSFLIVVGFFSMFMKFRWNKKKKAASS